MLPDKHTRMTCQFTITSSGGLAIQPVGIKWSKKFKDYYKTNVLVIRDVKHIHKVLNQFRFNDVDKITIECSDEINRYVPYYWFDAYMAKSHRKKTLSETQLSQCLSAAMDALKGVYT